MNKSREEVAASPTAKPLPELLQTIKQLPSPPEVCLAVMRAAKQEETSLADLGALVESDPALAAKVLRIANSAFFAVSNKVTSIRLAVSLLGFATVKTVALGFFLHNQFSRLRMEGLDYPDLGAYSLTTSVVCEALAAQLQPEIRDEAGAVGLLHEVGVMVLSMTYNADYQRLLSMRSLSGQPLHVEERRHLGLDHAAAGRLLLAEWKLPDRLLNAVESHHELDSNTSDRTGVILNKILMLGADSALMFFEASKDEGARRALAAAGKLFGWRAADLVPVLSAARADYAKRFECLQSEHSVSLTSQDDWDRLCESLTSEAQELLASTRRLVAG